MESGGRREMRSDGGGAGVARALGTFGVLSVDSCMRSRSVVSRTDAADSANRLQGPTHRAIISTPRHATPADGGTDRQTTARRSTT